MKFFIEDFFSKCDQIRRNLGIWPHLLTESLMENFIFCAVVILSISWSDFVCKWLPIQIKIFKNMLYPANIYLLKVNNRNTRKRCEIYSKLTIKTLIRKKINISKYYSPKSTSPVTRFPIQNAITWCANLLIPFLKAFFKVP